MEIMNKHIQKYIDVFKLLIY